MPESKTWTDPDGKKVQLNIGGRKVRPPVSRPSPFAQKDQSVGASPFRQEGQKVGKVVNFITRGNQQIPLDEATPEEKEAFYKSFPDLRPKE